jgi:hypothetical protein
LRATSVVVIPAPVSDERFGRTRSSAPLAQRSSGIQGDTTMMKSRLLAISASLSICLAVSTGCASSVDAPSHDALEDKPDAAAPGVPAPNEVNSELVGLPLPRPICIASLCNSACAAQTGFPGNSGGICEGTTCTCCSNQQYPAKVSAELFDLLVASQLSGIKVTVAGNNLTVTMPKALGGATTTKPITSSANIAFVSIPSEETSTGWQWSMSPDSNLITITSNLDATITGSWSGVNLGPLGHVGSCGVTAVISNAPVTITLQNNVNYTLTGPENYLSVQSVNIPLSGNNTEANGCSFVPADDIRGQFQSQLESNLQSQLDGISAMSTMMDTIVQTIANDDPAALNFPVSLSPGMSWSCGTAEQAALGTGAITGECQRSCN